MAYLDESLAPGETIVARFPLHWTAKWRLIVYLLLAIPTGRRRRVVEEATLPGDDPADTFDEDDND